MRMVGPRPDTAERTDVHDAASAARHHLPCRFLTAEERGFEIDVMNKVPVSFRDVQRVEASKASGVVDKAIERSKGVLNLAEQAANVGNTAEIGLKDGSSAAVAGDFLCVTTGSVVVDSDVKAAAG